LCRRLKVAMLAVLSSLAGCAGAAPPPASQITQSSQIVSVLRARETHFHTVRATGSVEHFGRQGRVRGDLTLYVQLPDRMRVEMSAFGHTASIMVADGTQFLLLQGNQLLIGPARACVAAQLLGIPMEPHEVATVLTGGAPLLSEQLTPPHWESGHYVVEATGEQGARERIEMDLPSDQRGLPAERQEPRLHRVQYFDRDGLRADITYENYRTVANVPFPDRVHIVMPREHADTMVRFREVEPDFTPPANPDLPPDAPRPNPFQLRRPQGIEEVPIAC
jgi:hypothetical protein